MKKVVVGVVVGLVGLFVVLPMCQYVLFRMAAPRGGSTANAQAVDSAAVERYYRPLAERAATVRSNDDYRLILVVTRNGKRLAEYEDLAAGSTVSSRDNYAVPFSLSEQAKRTGGLSLEAPLKRYSSVDVQVHTKRMLRAARNNSGIAALAPGTPLNSAMVGLFFVFVGVMFLGLIVLVVWLVMKWPQKQWAVQLRGPVLVNTQQFNQQCGGNRGIGFSNNYEWPDSKNEAMVHIPRSLESSHFLILGDSGTGKSTLIRQMLYQIERRGDAAVIFDPAQEYTRAFYNPQRGDLILNPLDVRMPYWSPGDEVRTEAETTTMAASMFPDKPKENSFFTDAPRKIFARLLAFKPSPEELTRWMSSERELEAKLKGTELESMIHPHAGAQRAGVISSLNMVADSLRMLPRREQTNRTWTALEWMQERRGWIFLTSIPELRKRLFPLTSFWLDLMVLRSMNQGRPGVRPVWFVLDELASLQRLPQLHTAVTENRKSGNPVVLGFQGRSQLETRYGHDAEAMLSQPATKIFLRTSEPNAAMWISKTIGEIEVERRRESFTRVEWWKQNRTTSWQRRTEPLVMASQIGGLPPLNGYVKVGNMTVPICFLPLANSRPEQEGFIERPQPPLGVAPEPEPVKAAAAAVASVAGAQQQAPKADAAAEQRRAQAQEEHRPLFD